MPFASLLAARVTFGWHWGNIDFDLFFYSLSLCLDFSLHWVLLHLSHLSHHMAKEGEDREVIVIYLVTHVFLVTLAKKAELNAN